jgi:4-diphosphocytidyl-2-C-methyl-D-erythritol kinase
MLTLKSPAKINLFLKIVGKRPDGFHELASLFQAISLTDTIHFSLHDSDQLTCNDVGIPLDRSNLVLKAADLFRRKTGLKFGLKAHLEKNIPYQSGLGGGSGNAATTLWALNRLLRYNANAQQLSEWSGDIGSDISFFFSQGTAYCTGRGEIVQSLPALPSHHLWIVKPPQGLSTPAVYKQVNLQKLPVRSPEKSLESIFSGKSEYFNDLEGPAFLVMPELLTLKNQLLNIGFKDVVLTGSGSGFYCFGDADPRGIPDVSCHQVSYLNRQADQWY